MKIVPGNKQFDGSITATTMSLGDALLTRPEISTKVVELFKNTCSLTAYLTSMGKTKKDVTNTDVFKIDNVYGNPKVMWPIIGFPERVVYQVASATQLNGTTVPSTYAAGTEYYLYIDSPYFNPNDIITTTNRQVQLFIKGEGTMITPTKWRYKFVLNLSNSTDTIPASLLAQGEQLGRMATKFPELSLTGYESHNYPEWYSNRMCIQRLKASISGSAFKSKLWIEHNGKYMYWNHQEANLMRKAHLYRENDIIYGKATTDVNDTTFVFDEDGKPIVSGDGIIEQMDYSLRRKYTLESDGTIDPNYFEDMMQDIKIMANHEGVLELVVAGGNGAITAFHKTMRNIYKYEPSVITKRNSKGLEIGTDFIAYYLNGVRLIPLECSAMDAPNLPSKPNSLTGRANESYRMLLLNTGITSTGDNNVEMVTLGNGQGNRAFTRKVINGMESLTDSEVASTSLDGLAVQVLMESGVIVRNPFSCGMLEVID